MHFHDFIPNFNVDAFICLSYRIGLIDRMGVGRKIGLHCVTARNRNALPAGEAVLLLPVTAARHHIKQNAGAKKRETKQNPILLITNTQSSPSKPPPLPTPQPRSHTTEPKNKPKRKKQPERPLDERASNLIAKLELLPVKLRPATTKNKNRVEMKKPRRRVVKSNTEQQQTNNKQTSAINTQQVGTPSRTCSRTAMSFH